MENQEPIQHSIFDDLDTKLIAPQNFPQVVAACCVCAVLSVAASFFYGGIKSLIYLLQMSVALYLLLQLKVYLRNFRAERAGRWLRWLIGFAAALLVLSLLRHFYTLLVQQRIVSYDNTFFLMLQPFFSGLALLGGIIAQIGFGISLQQIENDFIGLLRPIGIVYAYITPAVLLLITVIAYSEYLLLIFRDHIFFVYVSGSVAEAIPSVLMAVMFYRAMRYMERQPN